MIIDFQTDPSQYRHWRISYDKDVASLYMDVDEDGGLFDGYQLKLNSYDLGVDIELADIVQRMRFEHPEIKVVVLRSANDAVFCAGANIRMLGRASHAHKVNFCKFTNETRMTFESAETESGQKYMCAIKGACAGGGYELALACNYILLTDDRNSHVALPEVPLLAVLPGTGGITRIIDKRKVRRDRADVFCSTEEGVKGQRAADWNLVDEVVPNIRFNDVVAERARQFADKSRKLTGTGIQLGPLERQVSEDSLVYSCLTVTIDRRSGKADILLRGPDANAPADTDDLHRAGDRAYLLRLARELDDAILHLRFNERELGLIIFRSQGEPEGVLEHEKQLLASRDNDWLANEILMYWKRVLKRLDITSRTLIALVEHGSCFAGVLAEILWASDRSYMMDGEFENDDRPEARLVLSEANFGLCPMANNRTRLQNRFPQCDSGMEELRERIGESMDAAAVRDAGLVTETHDEIDWDDEIRMFLEERASFSPDALTGMEANLRATGPETMETRIFGRLTAWQNWIFQRPNAVGESGALQRYGSGLRGAFDMERV